LPASWRLLLANWAALRARLPGATLAGKFDGKERTVMRT
jgi:hypothetical protein